jgi:hypothetical protein
VVLVGAAGVGKTRLARQAVHRWAANGRHAWMVGTRAGSSIPLGAVSHVLPADRQPADSAALVAAMAACIAADAGGRRTVVGLDGANLLDEASTALLHQLVTRGAIVVVATVRAGEPVGDTS